MENETEDQVQTDWAREERRSFVLGVFNGAAFRFAESLIDPPLVLTWFVSDLTTSNLLRGLVAPLGDACWFLPQIFVSARVQRMRYKKPSYTWAAVGRTIAWVSLAVAVWFVHDPLLLLVGFFLLYMLARLLSGVAGLAFFDVVAKTVPARRRGRFFAWRQFLGGLFGLGGGWIVKTLINHPDLPFPRDYALLFALYCVTMAPGLFAFGLIREPPGAVVSEPVTVGEQLQRAFALLRLDQVYRRYIGARLILALALIALPFYGIYAKDVLGAPDWMVGVYSITRLAALLVSNLFWGWLSDRKGNRIVMRVLNANIGLNALLAAGLVVLVALLRPQGTWLPYLALPLYALDGAARPAYIMAGGSYLLELAPEKQRALYMGFTNTLMSVGILVSGMGGLVVDLIGFGGLFALAAGLCLAGYALATGLPEPREQGG